MKVNKFNVAVVSIITIAIGIVVGTFIVKYLGDKDLEIIVTPIENEIPILASPSVNEENEIPILASPSVNEENVVIKYNAGEMVDAAKSKLSDALINVVDRFMTDGHTYEIYNEQIDTVQHVVIQLNNQFSSLNYSVFNRALLTGSGSEGTTVVSESSKDGETIGDPIISTTVPVDEYYPMDVTVDVTGLDYVVIVDEQQNLYTYNFNLTAK